MITLCQAGAKPFSVLSFSTPGRIVGEKDIVGSRVKPVKSEPCLPFPDWPWALISVASDSKWGKNDGFKLKRYS